MSQSTEDILDGHVAQLMEHFDTVEIFVTSYQPNQTTNYTARGSGNWFARKGQIQEWIMRSDRIVCEEVRNENE